MQPHRAVVYSRYFIGCGVKVCKIRSILLTISIFTFKNRANGVKSEFKKFGGFSVSRYFCRRKDFYHGKIITGFAICCRCICIICRIMKEKINRIEKTILHKLKHNTTGEFPSIIGYIIYGFVQTKTTFYIFMFSLGAELLLLATEASLHYMEKKTMRGALSVSKWSWLIICLITFIVGIVAPYDVLYKQ